MKRLLAILMSMFLLILPATAESLVITGTAHGNNGAINVKVAMNGDRIESIETEAAYETPGLGLPAVQAIAEAIIEQQILNVDVVTGATISSMATMAAVENALKTAGIDPSRYRRDVPVGESIEKSADVVVVGGGFAGMVAAVKAAEEGAQVILAERSGQLGGNARFAMGWISGAGFAIQKNLGVEDTPEQFYADIIGFADGEENLIIPTARYYAEHSGPAIDWLQANGVEFKDELNPGIYDPMSVLRVAWGSRMGNSLIGGMQQQLDRLAEEGRVEILLNTRVEELITSDGAVKGIRAAQHNGNVVTVNAKATILAAGGYEASEDKLSAMFDHVARSFMTASTGDTVDLAIGVGAATHHMDSNTVTGGVLPNDGFYSNIYMNTTYGGLIFVDINGQRVFDEMGSKTRAKSDAWVKAPGNTLYAILTEDMLDHEDPILSCGNAWMPTKDAEWSVWNEQLGRGELIVKADTVESLADVLNMPALIETITAYNRYVADGVDADFGRTDNLQALENGPFYAIRTIPYCGWASGGPMANENMEVLDTTGAVIPGLYVAGEGAGHALVAGGTPISGMYLGMSATFGIDAGENAAGFSLKQGIRSER